MDKKNKEPLIKQPVTLPRQVYVEGDSYRPAGNDSVEQPQDVGAELKKGTEQLEQGISTGSFPDIQEGTRITTGVANVLSGADPMRPAKASQTNADSIPGAYEEVTRYKSTLLAENPGVFRRVDTDRLAADMAGRAHAVEMRAIYTSRATQMDTLVRHYEGEAAPTLVAIFRGCRVTVEGHADLQGNMPELIKLSVGAQQDAASSRTHNDKVRAQALGAHGSEQSPAPPPPAPGTTTTVTTPAPVVTPAAPAKPPVAAHAPRHPKPRTPKS